MKKVITWILYIAHIVCFCIAKVNLEGHIFGAPDEFGDYARGYYNSEVSTIILCIILMWIIWSVMVIVQYAVKGNDKDLIDEGDDPGLIKIILLAFINCPATIAFIGSIIVSFDYFMLD